MDGSNLIFVVMPIVMAVCLAAMIALPYIGGRQQARASAASRQPGPDAITAATPPRSPAAGGPASPSTITATVAESHPPQENRIT